MNLKAIEVIWLKGLSFLRNVVLKKKATKIIQQPSVN
jgi:hypothetical protein